MSHIFGAGRSSQHRSLRYCFPPQKKNHAWSRFLCHQPPSTQSFYCTLYRFCVAPAFATCPPPVIFNIVPSLCFAMLRQAEASSATSRPVLKASILLSIYAVSYSHLPPAPLPSNFISYPLYALSCFDLPPAPLPSNLVFYPLYEGFR